MTEYTEQRDLLDFATEIMFKSVETAIDDRVAITDDVEGCSELKLALAMSTNFNPIALADRVDYVSLWDEIGGLGESAVELVIKLSTELKLSLSEHDYTSLVTRISDSYNRTVLGVNENCVIPNSTLERVRRSNDAQKTLMLENVWVIPLILLSRLSPSDYEIVDDSKISRG